MSTNVSYEEGPLQYVDRDVRIKIHCCGSVTIILYIIYMYYHLSLVERLSSSRRFCFKPIRNCLKTKITLKVFYYNIFWFVFCFNLMVSSIARW